MLQTSGQAQAELHQHHPLLLLCHASRCARRHVLHAQALDSCLVDSSGWTACAAFMNAILDYEIRATVCVPALQVNRQLGVADRARASELMLSATFSMAAWQQANGACSGCQRCKQVTSLTKPWSRRVRLHMCSAVHTVTHTWGARHGSR